MGKFRKELESLQSTYHFAVHAEIGELLSFVRQTGEAPLIAVGSGGSLTAGHMAVLLHQDRGIMGKCITPLELIQTGRYIRNANVLLLTAGGNNKDILAAHKFAIGCHPRQLLSLTMATSSKLAAHGTRYLGFDLPSGEDGFLAVNSLLATITILIRAYGYQLPETLPNEQPDVQPLIGKTTLAVLYGSWGLPVAMDIESKFIEAALGNIQLADYRNFGHGRWLWLEKHPTTTGIVALITPGEEDLAERTLKHIPTNIPIIRLSTQLPGPVGSLEMFVKALHMVHQIGTAQGIDPGRPGIPRYSFGLKLYGMSIESKRRKRPVPTVT